MLKVVHKRSDKKDRVEALVRQLDKTFERWQRKYAQKISKK
jgi:hypothetical protein